MVCFCKVNVVTRCPKKVELGMCLGIVYPIRKARCTLWKDSSCLLCCFIFSVLNSIPSAEERYFTFMLAYIILNECKALKQCRQHLSLVLLRSWDPFGRHTNTVCSALPVLPRKILARHSKL